MDQTYSVTQCLPTNGRVGPQTALSVPVGCELALQVQKYPVQSFTLDHNHTCFFNLYLFAFETGLEKLCELAYSFCTHHGYCLNLLCISDFYFKWILFCMRLQIQGKEKSTKKEGAFRRLFISPSNFGLMPHTHYYFGTQVCQNQNSYFSEIGHNTKQQHSPSSQNRVAKTATSRNQLQFFGNWLQKSVKVTKYISHILT